MERWVVMNKKADFYGIGEKFGIDPVIARLIRNRDIIEEKEIDLYLNGRIEELPSPKQMKDVEKAVSILIQKIREGKRIRIISDYDVDGVTSNYILYKGLSKCGALVDYKIPDRILDG
ncbi:MAG: single-stranded-DNA-specific exonuclease RecJ, partial [Lachnospiraceae bacterium]|nr:single-stranded-DNA-specific exonuclease RecJ [Lachnospiraceae bacterium]